MKSALFLRDPLGVSRMEKDLKRALAVYADLGKDRKFGSQDQLLKDLAAVATAREWDFFVLVPGFLKPAGLALEGYRLQHTRAGSGEWEKSPVEWPQVVLRRMVNYPASMKRVIISEEERLEKDSQLITLPRRMSNKWKVYQQLQKDAFLRTYLPETFILRQPSEFFPLLDSLTDCYIKPVLGSQGNRIMRIQREENALLLAASQRQIKAFSAEDKEGLWQEVNGRLSGHTAILQETIELLRTKNGEPIDLRYLVQAMPDHRQPNVTVIARVGKKSGVTTNLHTGGQALTPRKILSMLSYDQAMRWQRGMEEGKKVARKVFQWFQRAYPPLVELGIDFAVDEAGRVYFLEINPCPGRRMLRTVSKDWRIQSLERIVDYANYLTTRNT